MKRTCARRVITFCLILCLLCSTVCPVSAETATNSTTKIEDIGNGKMFIQETDEKLIAIGADNSTHIITISTKYTTAPETVYQWIFTDYPDEEFNMSDLSFWEGIIDYAEERTAEATLVHFTTEEVSADAPMVISSAGADLIEDLEKQVGSEHYDQYVSTRVINGKIFHMYEHLTFNIYISGAKAWNTVITIASLVVGVLGLNATTAIMSTVCNVLGITFTVGSATISAGKINVYTCEANYHRYVKLDSGSKYALTDKFVAFKGYEDTNLNSSGRASIVTATKSEVYGISQDYFNNGIFDDAYNNYITEA